MSQYMGSIDFTPETILQEALGDVRSGERECNKMLILTLCDDGGKFLTGYYNSGLSCSQAIAMLEIMKATFLAEMNIGQNHDDEDTD